MRLEAQFVLSVLNFRFPILNQMTDSGTILAHPEQPISFQGFEVPRPNRQNAFH